MRELAILGLLLVLGCAAQPRADRNVATGAEAQWPLEAPAWAASTPTAEAVSDEPRGPFVWFECHLLSCRDAANPEGYRQLIRDLGVSDQGFVRLTAEQSDRVLTAQGSTSPAVELTAPRVIAYPGQCAALRIERNPAVGARLYLQATEASHAAVGLRAAVQVVDEANASNATPSWAGEAQGSLDNGPMYAALAPSLQGGEPVLFVLRTKYLIPPAE